MSLSTYSAVVANMRMAKASLAAAILMLLLITAAARPLE
jgi:hypothetical protein